ncbi:30S ribosomal protein S1 [Desulfobacula sp.]|uniref:30S ribosomal protein S1 n=1 Tax=Desulfobacula sp. TaxID=2593537 RepID=UPI0026134305|nr:30S ribosomal protein S1 [Desulfobacula sp.]
MNNIAEENENQKMNTETLEKKDDLVSEEEQAVTEPEEEQDAPMSEEEDAPMPEEDESASMPEITGDETMEELLDIYESSLKKFEEGQVVTGTVISVGRDTVLVDVGYKSEGQISIHEFIDEEGNVNVNVNDEFEVMIEVWDEEEETVLLSHEKAKKVKIWDAIKDIYDDDGTIEGVITSRVKGGFSVDIGLLAFLPGSQADLRPIRNMDEMVNQTYTFKILKYNKKRNNIVLSRRVLLEAVRDELRSTTLEAIEDGKVMEGIVKNITEYGVFVDLGGVDGLLHITDISWGRVKHPSELFTIGDKINVKILSFDLEKERVSLGMKQLTPDPWTTAVDKFPVGSKISGKVVSLTDYGAFIELEEGVEGLIHVSEMSWTRKIRHPSQMVTVGEIVEAVVLDLKPDNRRISLGIKQTVDNPWEVISQKYPVGTIIEGKIKNITEFGLFIGIDDDIDGLVHISDISWTKRIKHPSEIYKKNDTIQAVVLDIDKSNERFSLGIKQTQADPWESVGERYKVGKEISGVITNLTDFGVFVELEEGIEGLVHVSEISKENVKSPKEHYQIGETITAKVMNINSDERRIGLSIKRLKEDDDDKYLEDLAKNLKPATSSFGEMLRSNIQEQIEANKIQEAQKQDSEETDKPEE